MLRRRFAGPPQRAVVQLQEAAGGRLAGDVACQRRGALDGIPKMDLLSTWLKNGSTKHDDNQILGLEKGILGFLKNAKTSFDFF